MEELREKKKTLENTRTFVKINEEVEELLAAADLLEPALLVLLEKE